MELQLVYLVKMLILPPGSIVIILLLGLVLFKIKPRVAVPLLYTGTLLLFIFSLPVVAITLMGFVETYPPLSENTANLKSAQAIVVLGGGRQENAEEYGGDTVSSETLQRIRYAAHLYRLTKLPILVSAGSPTGEKIAGAKLMADALKSDYGIETTWIENKSGNTAENAIFSHQILHKNNIETVLLVTHAWHMPRAVNMFEQQGLHVIPAPTGFESRKNIRFREFVPSAVAMRISSWALHELIGIFWYKIRY